MLNKLLAGRYQIIKFLGSGGFGQTYIAEDTHRPGNPTCVVKHLKPINSQPAYLEAAKVFFQKEAEALEKLGNYPQIPRLLAYFEEDDEFYLVQEFIDGNVLTVEFVPGSCWSESQVVQLLQEILEILHFVHSNGVIHRDLKPSNIIRRREDNKLVLVDFGIVKEISMQLSTAQSQMTTSVIIGTAGYMSPEQARGKPRFSSDIYALGVIAIQGITGLIPQELKEDAKGEIDWQNQAQVSPQLATILSRMVRYYFQERYESVQEVLNALKFLPASPGLVSTKLNPIPQYSANKSVTTHPRGVTSGAVGSNVVSPSKKNPHLGNTETNSASPTVSSVELPNSAQQCSQTKGFVKVLKSPIGVTVGIVTLAAILAAFGLDWYKNQSFLANVEEIKSLNQQKEYSKCIEKGEKVSLPSNNSSSHEKVKNDLIATVNKCRISQAKLLVEQGDFAKAISEANKITKNQPFSEDSQQLINIWSKKIIDKATEDYENSGDLDNAITTLNVIPSISSHYVNAQELKQQWQQQNKADKEYLKIAQRALMQNRYNDAIAATNKISNTPYWNIKKEGIIQEAKSSIKKDVAKSSNPFPKSASTPTPSINTTHVKPVVSIPTPKVIKPKINKNSPKTITKEKTRTNPTTIDNCQDSQSIFAQGSNCNN